MTPINNWTQLIQLINTLQTNETITLIGFEQKKAKIKTPIFTKTNIENKTPFNELIKNKTTKLITK